MNTAPLAHERYGFTVVGGARVGAGRPVRAMAWVPEACTLPTVEQPLRVAEFDELFATAVRPVERVDLTGCVFTCRR